MATISLDCNGQIFTVEITEVDGNLQFEVSVPAGFADIRGLFFNMLDESLTSGLSVFSGLDVTDSQFANNAVHDLGNGANMNGSDSKTGEELEPFDAGVEIGHQGIGMGDDFYTTTFVISHSSEDLEIDDIDLESIGLRLTSVLEPEIIDGVETGEMVRTGSLKVILEEGPPNSPPGIENEKRDVYESALSNGTDPTSDGEMVTGNMTIIDAEGDAAVVSVTFGATTVNVDGILGYAEINGDYGTLRVYSDGAYEYTLTTNSLDHDVIGEGAGGEVSGDDGDGNALIEELFLVTVSDGEFSANGDLRICVHDDAPLAAIQRTNDMVMADETVGLPDPDSADGVQVGNDEGANVPTISATATTLIGRDTADLIDTVGSNPGADGGTTVVTFNILMVDSGLKTTDNHTINLVAGATDNIVIGRDAVTDDDIFALSIDNDGNVLLEQYDSLRHGDMTSDDDVISLAVGKLEAVVTVTDNEGDFATESIDLGGAIKFDDDGPTAGVTLTGNMAVTDETVGLPDPDGPGMQVGNDETNAGAPLIAGETAIGFAQATLIDTSTSDAGADDEGATVATSLDLSSLYGGGAIGIQTTAGEDIELVKNGGVIEGRVIGSGQAVFAIAILGGLVTLEQYESLDHLPSVTADDILALGANLVDAVVTVTDGDGDSDETRIDIGANIKFEDDGPFLGDIANSTNSLAFAMGTTEMKSFSYDVGEDDEGAPGLALVGYTDPDDAADLAASGLGELEALLGLDITASQTGNVVTYATSEGDLFELTLSDDGKWTFDILQDAPFVSLGLDLGALEPGSPVEDEILTGQTGSGLDVKFDGLNWRSFAIADNILNTAANLGPGNTLDDINTNQQGFGIKDGQASQVNHLEGFFATFGDGAGGDNDEIVGFFFDIEGIGNIKTVKINWQAFDDLNDNGVLDGGEPTLFGTRTVTLPQGNNDIQFLLSADPDVIDNGNNIVKLADGFEFDNVYIQVQTPNGLASPTNVNAWNDGVRFNDFGTIERAEIPPVTLAFSAQVTDGDTDTTQVEDWFVFIG